MTALAFPDTTVLVNFALLGRMDLLKRLMATSGRWGQSVASECDASSRVPGLESLAEATGIFGEPWAPSPSEHVMIMILREGLASAGDPLTRHLGEAETIVLARDRAPGSRFVTDDRDAMRAATAEGLTVVTTRGLLVLCEKLLWISESEHAAFLGHLSSLGRHLPE